MSQQRKTVKRAGSEIVEIRAYAPGDGLLSFAAVYTQDNPNGKRLEAAYPPPTHEECVAVCPYGWIVIEDGASGVYRARKVQ